VHRAQAGLIADMDYFADVLFGRIVKAAEHASAKEAVLSV